MKHHHPNGSSPTQWRWRKPRLSGANVAWLACLQLAIVGIVAALAVSYGDKQRDESGEAAEAVNSLPVPDDATSVCLGLTDPLSLERAQRRN